MSGSSTSKKPPSTNTTRLIGLAMASVFTLAYIIAPSLMLISVLAILFQWPSLPWALVIASPVIFSILLPPIPSPWILRRLGPMCEYFNYEQIIEEKPVDVRSHMRDGTKTYILAAQPHGVVSLCGICSAVSADHDFQGRLIPTGVAEAVLSTPILKHVMGIFHLISASKKSLIKNFQKGGVEGSVVLYVGGIAELFVSSEKEEMIYLKKRKGFIKLALQCGVDIVPIYLFGNTTCLSVLKTGLLATLSRKTQVSLTYFWGRCMLPIPRPVKVR
jgi:hypothetical protein